MAANEFGERTIVATQRALTAVVKAQVRFDKIPEAERSSRAKLNTALPTLGVAPVGKGFTLWQPPVDGVIYLEPGTIVAREFVPVGDIVPSTLPAGRAAYLLMVGPYDGLQRAWNILFDWCSEQDLKLAGTNWQLYDDENSAKPQTSLYALLA